MRTILKTILFLQILYCTYGGIKANAETIEQSRQQNYTDSIFKDMEICRFNKNFGEIQTIHQDEEGYIWIGTRLGLYRYDGFQAKRYKNSFKRPTLLSSNKINCLGDAENELWIGTDKGLNRMNLKNGESKQYHFNDFINCDYINRLLIIKSAEGKMKQMWVGTEGGLYVYDPDTDSFTFLCDQRGNSVVPHCAVKSLFEDHKGYIWIGTWDKGLFRYDQKKKEFYSMPKFNDLNSAHVVFEDKKSRLWVGTWGKGIYLINNPHDTNKPLDFKNFMVENTGGMLSSNIIYTLTEDPYTGLLWIGTWKGLMFYANEQFYSIPEDKMPSPTFFNFGASELLRDRNGNIWLNASSTRLVSISVRPKNFTNHLLPQPLQEADGINCITYDHGGNTWIGLERNGIICTNRQNGTQAYTKDIPAMKGMKTPSKVNTIYETKDSSLLIGTTSNGMIKISKDKQHAVVSDKSNTPWLPDNCIYAFTEDNNGNLLIGTWKGLCIMYRNGKGLTFRSESLTDLESAQVRHIMLSTDGTIWLSTKNKGIIQLKGNVHNPQSLRMRIYSHPLDTEMQIPEANKMLQDSKGRIWACSLETGLMLYDEKRDGFVCVNRQYGIPDDDICSIEEGKDGALWISSRQDIMCLQLKSDGSFAKLRYIPNSNELVDNDFGKGISCQYGNKEICFGGTRGYTTVTDKQQSPQEHCMETSITDIKIFNTSLELLPVDERNEISEFLPPYTDNIKLSHSQNDLTIEFSSLSYNHQQESRFAYMLEGHDKEWVYLEAGLHSAYFSNLPSGTYTFHLKSTDANGIWRDNTKQIKITILPPLWLRWEAIVLYAILLAAICYFLLRHLKQRERQRRELQLVRLANEKIEELNHKKLQFFTNITHDLMTPLTVVQATVSELEMECPQKSESYRIIQNNLSRQMRLLQQILEFRKAETGNLQLKVSKGDIAAFCQKEIESIDPLMKRKKLHLSLLCSPESIIGYFDSDALDKILYNLLSNSAKYTEAMGYVQVTLTYGEEAGFIKLTVKDNGKGIPASKQADLFKRFYEGEHRKFNTYGTGIGLSLTKDLVNLHHGSIHVESKENEGTTFTVILPIEQTSFTEEEIDDSPLYIEPKEEDYLNEENGQQTAGKPATSHTASEERKNIIGEEDGDMSISSKSHTLLIVEDNDELITLMKRLLQNTYHVITAYNGAEAIEIMENEHIDLVVTDVMMPVLNGIELLRHLRSTPKFNDCPVIMLTAKRNEQDRAEAYEAGADAYITKPFHLSVLQARIQNLLLRKEKAVKEMRNKIFDGLGELDITDADEEFMRKCVNCVNKHLSDANFDQQVFADETGNSKSGLYKKLKVLTGMNTSAFIRNVRMKAACEIALANPTIRISDLAYSVGYNDPKYFSSCFKKDFGMIPSEYIKMRQEKEAGQET
ncbi:MAG: response regulator [Bacteroides sp.]|nr:response regulator [Roseburia sp.]MCM1346761.1 response regulator [Bacteroides sp.]MCM1420453.1 response regulator [Bacteroides sp.]